MVQELRFDMRFKTDVPKFPEEGSQVRLNAAAILREDALLKRKQGQDTQQIKVIFRTMRTYAWVYTVGAVQHIQARRAAAG